jgi:hypothetical protein
LEKKALAGLGCFTLTAGGDFHPALRTSAARLGDLKGIMTLGEGIGKDLRHWKSAYLHDQINRVRQPDPTRDARIRGDRTRNPRIRFRFVLIGNVNAGEELWTGGALPVDGLPVPLRGFRKSHHLIRAGPEHPSPEQPTKWGLQSAATRKPRVGLRAYQPSY